MTGRDIIQDRLSKMLRQAECEATAVVQSRRLGLTRFANNYAHQNTQTHATKVSVKARIDGRVGVAVASSLDPDSLLATLRRAEDVARSTPAIAGLPPLPGPQEYDAVPTHAPATADYTPEDRARAIRTICDAASGAKAVASGLLSTSEGELAVANSRGLFAFAPLTASELMVIASDGSSSGYSAGVTRDVTEFDFTRHADIAVQKCVAGRKRGAIEPGDYEVVLEPAAVADALEWLSYIGFGSKKVEEKTSFLADRFGQKLVGENITIRDDATDIRALGVPFDGEGMPKHPVDFFRNGVVGGCVTDSASAARAGATNTGHAVPPEEGEEGAMAMHVVMDAGDATLEDMIGSVERGVLVTRFHYINGFIDTRDAVLTGMTRDGTFLIENGSIACGLPNMRFMQSFLAAFRDVRRISRERRSAAAWWGDASAYFTPALRIGSFRFTGTQKEE